ncbi:Uncharacterized protein GBIM_17716 [Gryllus bimaculatus]|nr:Uncharacterized protein GBIM_17716 [Gryllus bimaculatus]
MGANPGLSLMIQLGCRLWNLSIASVVVLTFSNILLTVRLLHSSDCGAASRAALANPPRTSPPARAPAPPARRRPPRPRPRRRPALAAPRAPPPPPNTSAAVAASSLFRADLRLGRWDARHLYKMYDFAVVGERYAELSDTFSVCLATQSSVEKLRSLVQVAHHWSGPISAAVYAAGDDEYTLLQIYVAYLRKCFAAVRERVSFHLAYPKDRPPRQEAVELAAAAVLDPPARPELDCRRPESALAELLRLRRPDTFSYRSKAPYPQNHMRNLARRNCQADYVFLTDVDIIPSARLAEGLDVFLRGARCSGLCAYVIPTYELHDQVRFPRNKTDLVRLAKRGLARPFHQKVFIYNQFATNFSRWQESAESESSAVHISHNVTNFEFLYEPFYVAPDTVYEMYVTGYQFYVLSPVFTCHWGLQTKKQRPSWRERQNSFNFRQFEVFKHEIFARNRKELPARQRTSHPRRTRGRRVRGRRGRRRRWGRRGAWGRGAGAPGDPAPAPRAQG